MNCFGNNYFTKELEQGTWQLYVFEVFLKNWIEFTFLGWRFRWFFFFCCHIFTNYNFVIFSCKCKRIKWFYFFNLWSRIDLEIHQWMKSTRQCYLKYFQEIEFNLPTALPLSDILVFVSEFRLNSLLLEDI